MKEDFYQRAGGVGESILEKALRIFVFFHRLKAGASTLADFG
jgi:hypothetical protein